MSELDLYAVVALTTDEPTRNLVRGQTGTIVAILEPGVYEVEFSNNNGEAYAMAALSGDKLMRLYTEPVTNNA